MIKKYPAVRGELETLSKIRKGFSISRFGDGEAGVLQGTGYTREAQNDLMTLELNQVLDIKKKNHIIGIPTMDPKGSKYKNWIRHEARYAQIYAGKREKFYSSLISRPDCGEWMRTPDYAREVQRIWLDRQKERVTLVCSEGDRNKLFQVMVSTNDVDRVDVPFRGAYSHLGRVEEEVRALGNPLVILSHGVSATILAHKLSPDHVAVDIGSIGGFLAKMLLDEKWNLEDREDNPENAGK